MVHTEHALNQNNGVVSQRNFRTMPKGRGDSHVTFKRGSDRTHHHHRTLHLRTELFYLTLRVCDSSPVGTFQLSEHYTLTD